MKRSLIAFVLIAAWATSALAQTQFIAPYSGAVARTTNSKMADIVSVFDFIPVSLQAAIKAGTSTTDVSSYLTAMQSAVPSGVTFLFPSGTYNIGAGTTTLTGRVIYAVGVTFTGGGSIAGAVSVFNQADGRVLGTGMVNNTVGNSQIRQGTAHSVVGVGGNTTANVADIAATGADQTLRADSFGTGVGFGSIDLSKSGAVGSSLLGATNIAAGAAATNVGTLGGDLTGTLPNPSLANIGAAAGPVGDSTHVSQVTIDAKGRVSALSSVSLQLGPSPCGWRQNMALEPQSPNWTTQLHLVGPAYFTVCDGTSWVPANAAIASTGARTLQTVGAGGYGTAAHNTIDLTLHNGAGCTSPCVSTEATAGGIDPGTGTGVMEASTEYNIYIVARSAAFAPDEWGLVISKGSGAGSRGCTQGPSATVQAVYPYYSCIGWTYTNAGATGQQYQICKSDHWWWFCGNPGTPVVVASGSTAGAWTLVFTNPATMGFSGSSGTYIFSVAVLTAGTYVNVATNDNFGGDASCGTVGVGIIYNRGQCTVIANGGVGYKSTDASAFLFVVGGYDGF